MSLRAELCVFIECFHRALMAQMHYVQDHPEVQRHMEAFQASLAHCLELEQPLLLTLGSGHLCYANEPLEGSPHAVQAMAQVLEDRRIGGLAFHQGVEPDDLQLLFFALLMPPHRLTEMGGAGILFSGGGRVQILGLGEEYTEEPALPEPVQETVYRVPSPAVLASDFRTLFATILQLTSNVPSGGVHSPWSREQRESLCSAGFLQPDFSGLVGAGEQLELGTVDTQTLRAALRSALSSLDPVQQGSLVLGLHTFPASEQALLSSLDYLAPELLAQAVADVVIRSRVSQFELALMVSAMFEGIKDRDLALDAIRGRLQLEGWSLDDLDGLQEAIQWECHGTDTKVRLTLMNRSIFDLASHQAMTFIRQLVRAKRPGPLRDLIGQLESGFLSPELDRRRLAAQLTADLAECSEEPGLPSELGRRIQKALHDHVAQDSDQQAVLWSCQGLESLLIYWMHIGDFDGIYQEMMALSEIILLQREAPAWKGEAIRNLLGRMASPLNLAVLTPLLHQKEDRRALTQLLALLSLMGRPAASYLMACLEIEEDRARRTQLMDAIRAIGRNAVPALIEGLASPSWFQVRNSAVLLGEIADASAFNEVARVLEHRDARVRRAVMTCLPTLGSRDQAAAAIAAMLPLWEPSDQLDALAALGDLRSPAAIPPISELVRQPKAQQEENARVRLRAVEVLGLIGTSQAVDPLAELFKKKGFLGGRESKAMRLTAAKSLSAVNTREAREAIAMALDLEPHEDVRSILRQYLVS